MWRVLPLLLAGCRFQQGALTDGDAKIDAPGDGEVVADTVDAAPLGMWGPATLVFPAVDDDDPTVTSDMRELYFNRGADYYVITRASIGAVWSTPMVVNELSSATATDTTPEISGDGLTIYLASARTPSLGVNDVWVSTRATRSDLWSMPVHVDELSTVEDEYAAAPTPDLKMIVWNRQVSGRAEDLFIATRSTPTGAWGTPVPLDTVNTVSREITSILSPDKRTLYLTSNRDGTNDLFVATRANVVDAFDTPVPISELNTNSGDADPWVSPDGRDIYFSSNRAGAYGIYHASR